MMDCINCYLNNDPLPTDSIITTNIGKGCPNRKIVRTEHANFYACPMCMHKFGPGTIYGTPGWYPGKNSY